MGLLNLKANMGGSASEDQFPDGPDPRYPDDVPNGVSAASLDGRGDNSQAVLASVSEEDGPALRPAGTIERWSCALFPDLMDNPYLPPEARVTVIRGTVYGNPAFTDGHPIRTSGVVRVAGKTVVTSSGSVYQLGTPDPDYVAWVNAHFGPWDEENPIRMATHRKLLASAAE